MNIYGRKVIIDIKKEEEMHYVKGMIEKRIIQISIYIYSFSKYECWIEKIGFFQLGKSRRTEMNGENWVKEP